MADRRLSVDPLMPDVTPGFNPGKTGTSSVSWVNTLKTRLCQPYMGRVCLLLLLVYGGLAGLHQASRKFFWFDEICTIAVAQQQSATTIWAALNRAADTNPPPFYFLETFASRFSADAHVGYRLPSIIAFLFIPPALFLFVRRYSGFSAAMTAALIPFVTPLYWVYAAEARPYALMTCCFAWALVAWQRTRRAAGAAALGSLLAAATSLHYYAVFALVPFGAAELARWFRTRQFRVQMWLALLCGCIPILAFWPLLSQIKHYYGTHFWAAPSIFTIPVYYKGILDVDKWWGTGVVVVLGVGLLLSITTSLLRVPHLKRSTGPPEEELLILGLIALPVMVYVASRLAHGGMHSRYVLPAILGISVAPALLTASTSRQVTRGLLAVVLWVFLFQQLEYWRYQGSAPSASATQDAYPELVRLQDMVRRSRISELPVVVSNGHLFLSMTYYDHRHLPLVYAVDPPGAVRAIQTDSVDLALLVLASYVPMQLEKLDSLLERSRRFLVYSGNDPMYDWLPAKLESDESISVRPIVIDPVGNRALYLVERKNSGNGCTTACSRGALEDDGDRHGAAKQ